MLPMSSCDRPAGRTEERSMRVVERGSCMLSEVGSSSMSNVVNSPDVPRFEELEKDGNRMGRTLIYSTSSVMPVAICCIDQSSQDTHGSCVV